MFEATLEMLQRGFVEPVIDGESAGWWDGIAAHRLLVPICRPHGHRWFPPAPACPYCGSPDHELREVSGEGTIYSWIVTRRAFHPAFKDDVPYVIAAVELAEGPRVIARLAVPPDQAIEAGTRVRAIYYMVADRTFLGFAPSR